MMNLRKILHVSLAVLSVCFFVFAEAAEKPGNGKNDKQSLGKVSGSPTHQILNINNITTWGRSDGESNHTPSGVDGVQYPVGTGTIVYEDGIVFGSKPYLNAQRTTPTSTQRVRVGGSTYLSNVGTKAGYVTGLGATAKAASPDLPDVRYYRVRRDYYFMTPGEYAFDAMTRYEHNKISEATQGEMDAIRAQYDLDWKNWPVDKGAPYIERNGKPGYQAPPAFGPAFTVDSLISGNYDEPGVGDAGTPADQLMWTVYNDLEKAQSLRFEGSEPQGLEIKVTTWGYKRSDAMGNCYFKRVKLTNKGGVDLGNGTIGAFYLDSMYVCQWSDIDLGLATDDLAGCDSARSMAFVWNGNASDQVYARYGLPPPASGYDFLAGPTIPGAATDSAVVDFKRVFGKKNLPMSGFSYFSAGSPYSDPPFADYNTGTGRWWNMLRGFAPLGTITDPPVYYNYPTGGYPTKFPLGGDVSKPAAPNNFIDGQGTLWSFAQGDRRVLLCTGPFTLDPGESQEVYVGYVAAIGADRISSVAVLKANDNAVQQTFDLLFKVAKAPAAPVVKVTELDGQILLDWGYNTAAVTATETKVADPGAYKFEGYNVYQFPTAGSQLESAVRVGTFDKVNDIKVVLDEQFSLSAGAFLKIPIQFGSDKGVVRFFDFKKDYVKDIDKLWNGQEYYYAVTAYSVTTVPGYVAALESSPNIITAVPKVPFGKVATSVAGDTVKMTKSGVSDGRALGIVVSPLSLTGHNYEITFQVGDTWSVVDKTANKTVISGLTYQGGGDEYPIVDGLLVKVFGAPNDFQNILCIANGTGKLAVPDMGCYGFNSSGFPYWMGFDRPQVPNKLAVAGSASAANGGMWGIHTGNGGIGTDPSFTNFKARVARSSTGSGGNWGRIMPNDYEIRFTAAGGKARAAFTTGAVVNVPFEVWYIGSGTPDNPADDYRMIPYFNDIDGNDQFNLAKSDHQISGGDNDPETDWIYAYEPTDKTPGQAGYNAAVAANFASGVGSEVLARLVFVNWNGGSISDPTWPANVNQTMPATGSVYRIITTKPNNPSVKYTYSTPAPLAGAEQDVASAAKIGVYPNPYYASNQAETSRFDRFVTFNNLPKNAIIRIFNLAGQMVRTLEKSSDNQFLRWDLMNMRNYPVASGIYIAYVELPDLGYTKTLKFSIIQQQEFLDYF